MVRLFNVYHPSRTFVLWCSEILLILFAYVVALLLRWGNQSYKMLTQPQGLIQLMIVTGTCMLCLYYFDLYNFETVADPRELLKRLLRVLGTASLILAGLYYLFPRIVVARGIFVLNTAILLSLLFCLRILFSRLNALPIRNEKVAMIGTGNFADELVREIRRRPELAINMVGYVDDQQIASSGPALECLGNIADLEKLASESGVDALIVVLRDRRGRLPVDVLLKLRMRGLKIQEGYSLYEQITGKIPVDNLFPSWLIFSKGFEINYRFMALQRIYSFALALFGLLLILPVMLVVALLIKLDSEGPIFYQQERIGRNSRIFKIAKFRSMTVNAEKDGAAWSQRNDSRVTRVGRFIRKFRLDELPQLWNILRGDMNLVGPRPERPVFVELLGEKLPYYRHRHVIRPGLTGWTQVRCRYGSSIEDHRERLCYDFFYIKNISASLDLYIIFQTVKDVLWGRGI